MNQANLNIRIIPIIEIDAREWAEFILTSSESTFFCSVDWWKTFEDSYILQIRNEKHELLAGVPFRILSVIPLIGYFFKFCWLDSSVLVNQAIKEPEGKKFKKMALDVLVKHLHSMQVIVMSISSKARSHDAQLFKSLGFDIEKCATLLLDLTKDENEIFSSFSKGNKSSIHKAQKMGVEVKIMDGESALTHVQEFCDLQEKLFEHKKGSYSKIYFKSDSYLSLILSSKYSKSYLAMAYYNGHPAAGAVLISFKKVIFYYLGASDFLLTKTSQASNFLHFEIIKFAKSNGFITYDFGGIPYTSDPSNGINGVFIFKKGFGGDRYEFDQGNYVLHKFRYLIIWKIRKYDNNPLFRFIYNLFRK